MTEDKTLKPKSFRIDDKTADKFKEISAQIGGNQQETLAKLIEAWEFQSGKAILTEKKADIEKFEKYVTALTRMYMTSLEDNQNLAETVRTEYDALLTSKDTTIQDLQSQLRSTKQLIEENTRLSESIESIRKELADKDMLNRALTDTCNNLKEKVTALSAEHENITRIVAERDDLKTKLDNKEREIFELEKKHNKEIQELKEQKQAEIDQYQKKYFELFEHMKN